MISNVNKTSERPLVTFALFAYNQEEYIRKAIEGAFAQTYEPLEIILSDDCSLDRTFEIMQEMASRYKGRHRLIVRKTKSNAGVLSHVLDVANIASGELFVLAAGDDFSKAFRVEEIAKEWMVTGAWGLHSRYDVCDAKGHIIEINSRTEDLFSRKCRLRSYLLTDNEDFGIVHGATSAYDMRLFDYIPKDNTDQIMSEDGVLSIFLAALGKESYFIDESLIIYRQHDGAVTMIGAPYSFISFNKSRFIIEKEASYSFSIHKRAFFLLKNLGNKSGLIRQVNMNALSEDIIFYGVKSGRLPFSLKNYITAACLAVRNRKIGSIVPALLSWKIGAFYLFVSHNAKITLKKIRVLLDKNKA